MKNLRHHMAVIVAASLLFALLLTTASVSMAGIFYMSEDGYYRAGSYSFYDSRLCGDTTDDYAYRVFSEYFQLYRDPVKNAEDAFRLQQFEREFAQENTNFLFTVTDPAGNVLLSNLQQTAVGQQRTYEYTLDGNSYLLNAYVKAPIAAEDRYAVAFQIFSTLYSMRYLLIGILAAAILSGGILFVFLMNAAGHRSGQEGLVLSGQDKIPLDLYGAAGTLALLLILRVSAELGRSLSHVWTENIWQAAMLCLLSLAASFISLASCMTIAARLKMGGWWKNTIIYRILSLIAKGFHLIKKSLDALFGSFLFYGKLWRLSQPMRCPTDCLSFSFSCPSTLPVRSWFPCFGFYSIWPS